MLLGVPFNVKADDVEVVPSKVDTLLQMLTDLPEYVPLYVDVVLC